MTDAPIGMPSRNLKFAIDFLARLTMGFCPVIVAISPVAASSEFELSIASPSPMLTMILSRIGNCIGLVYPNSRVSTGVTSDRYRDNRRGIIIVALPFELAIAGSLYRSDACAVFEFSPSDTTDFAGI